MKQYYVYILASKRNGALYIGLTNDLLRRIYEYKNDIIEGFTKKYSVHNLVYYERHNEINRAINREKQMEKWERQWKINLIQRSNPEWEDLYYDLIDQNGPSPSWGVTRGRQAAELLVGKKRRLLITPVQAQRRAGA